MHKYEHQFQRNTRFESTNSGFKRIIFSTFCTRCGVVSIVHTLLTKNDFSFDEIKTEWKSLAELTKRGERDLRKPRCDVALIKRILDE